MREARDKMHNREAGEGVGVGVRKEGSLGGRV